MQTRISYGYGFSSSFLKQSEFYQLIKSIEIQKYDSEYVQIVPFGNSKISHNWSAVILEKIHDNHHGQMLTISEIKEIENKYKEISVEKRKKFIEKLSTFKLEHLIEKIELLLIVEYK